MGTASPRATTTAAQARAEWKADNKRLAKARGTVDQVPPGAELVPYHVLEIERMAAQGMNLDQIGAKLRMPVATWDWMVANNPQVRDAYRSGAIDGVDIATGAMLRNVRAGDVAATRFYLERLGGEQFRKQPDAAPTVVVNTGPVAQVNVDLIRARLERQRRLIDGTSEDLLDVLPALAAPSAE